MGEIATDSTGIYSELGMNPHDCRLTVCYQGKCKTVYIADGMHDMKETAQVYLKKTMLELESARENLSPKPSPLLDGEKTR